MTPDRKSLQPGDLLIVDVFLDRSLPDVRGYQLHAASAGGTRGRLEVVDIVVREDGQALFAGLPFWRAFNVDRGQLVVGLDQPGIPADSGAYLATFLFRASADAAGRFEIRLLCDEHDDTHRTFVFPTLQHTRIDLIPADPAVVTITQKRSTTRR